MKKHFLVNIESTRCNFIGFGIVLVGLIVGIVLTGIWGFFVSDYYECTYNSINEKDNIMTYTPHGEMNRNVLIFLVLKRSSIDNVGLLLNVLTYLQYENESKTTLMRNSSVTCLANNLYCEPFYLYSCDGSDVSILLTTDLKGERLESFDLNQTQIMERLDNFDYEGRFGAFRYLLLLIASVTLVYFVYSICKATSLTKYSDDDSTDSPSLHHRDFSSSSSCSSNFLTSCFLLLSLKRANHPFNLSLEQNQILVMLIFCVILNNPFYLFIINNRGSFVSAMDSFCFALTCGVFIFFSLFFFNGFVVNTTNTKQKRNNDMKGCTSSKSCSSSNPNITCCFFCTRFFFADIFCFVIVLISILINTQSAFDDSNWIANRNVFHVFLFFFLVMYVIFIFWFVYTIIRIIVISGVHNKKVVGRYRVLLITLVILIILCTSAFLFLVIPSFFEEYFSYKIQDSTQNSIDVSGFSLSTLMLLSSQQSNVRPSFSSFSSFSSATNVSHPLLHSLSSTPTKSSCPSNQFTTGVSPMSFLLFYSVFTLMSCFLGILFAPYTKGESYTPSSELTAETSILPVDIALHPRITQEELDEYLHRIVLRRTKGKKEEGEEGDERDREEETEGFTGIVEEEEVIDEEGEKVKQSKKKVSEDYKAPKEITLSLSSSSSSSSSSSYVPTSSSSSSSGSSSSSSSSKITQPLPKVVSKPGPRSLSTAGSHSRRGNDYLIDINNIAFIDDFSLPPINDDDFNLLELPGKPLGKPPPPPVSTTTTITTTPIPPTTIYHPSIPTPQMVVGGVSLPQGVLLSQAAPLPQNFPHTHQQGVPLGQGMPVLLVSPYGGGGAVEQQQITSSVVKGNSPSSSSSLPPSTSFFGGKNIPQQVDVGNKKDESDSEYEFVEVDEEEEEELPNKTTPK